MLTRLLSPPTQCTICRGWDAERVCTDCRARFIDDRAPRCGRCGLRVPQGASTCGACLVGAPACDGVLAALDYAHPWDRLIARFKFGAALDLAAEFARIVERRWRASGDAPPQLLLPVPLSAQRLRERGYNQSWEIVRRLAAAIGCAADARALLRIRDTAHQLALPVEQRAANVRGAFAVEPGRRHALRGRAVTVFDDVMTTGATAAEVARTLRQAGAAEVRLWVLARTPAPTD